MTQDLAQLRQAASASRAFPELGHGIDIIARTVEASRRLVVKIGSDLVVDRNSGSIRQDWLATLVRDIARLRRLRCDVVLVSSGAIAAGRHLLGLGDKTLTMREQQAAAAAGQMVITRAYTEQFTQQGLAAAQILLTPDDTGLRQRNRNLRAMLTQLLSTGTIPIINENDAVTTGTTGFGDNDRLAARVAQILVADVLVLLSNIDGLYTCDPRRSAGATPIREIYEITSEIERMAGGASSAYSRGGMATKVSAARLAFTIGCKMVIADGRYAHPLSKIDGGDPCTWFLPSQAARIARKAAIASSFTPSGDLVLHHGAAEEIRLGRSLHLIAIDTFAGHFARGNVVVVRDTDGTEIARGMALCSSKELNETKRLLPTDNRMPAPDAAYSLIVHSDDLALSE